MTYQDGTFENLGSITFASSDETVATFELLDDQISESALKPASESTSAESLALLP